MMNLGRFFSFDLQHTYSSVIRQTRARGLLAINYVLLGIWFIWLLVGVVPEVLAGEELVPAGLLFTIAMPLLGLLNYLLLQRGRAELGAMILIGLITFTVVPSFLTGLQDVSTLPLVVPIVMAGLMLPRRGFWIITLGIVVVVLFGAIADWQFVGSIEIFPAEDVPLEFMSILLSVALVSILVTVFSETLQNTNLDFSDDIDQLMQVHELSQQIDLLDDENSKIVHTVSNLKTAMGYVFAQYYVVEDGVRPTRRITAAFGDHQITDIDEGEISDASAIMTAIQKREAVVVTKRDGTLQRKHLTAAATSSVAVPVIFENQLVGVLDVQSGSTEIVTANRLKTLQLLANRLAISVYQAQLVRDLKQELEEQSLYRSTPQPRERLSVQQGSNLEGQLHAIGFEYQEGYGDLRLTRDLSPELRPAMERGEIVVASSAEEQVVSIPIRSGSEILGAMSFSIPIERNLSERRIEMLQSVSERLALALENRRLLEQSQLQAQRESQANEIGNTLLAYTDVQRVLEIAAQEFNQALGAINTQIHVQPTPFQDTHNQNGDGS